jgi:hypothetical protein
MKKMRVSSFEEYWVHHVMNHQKPLTRGLHLAGFVIYICSFIPAYLWWDIRPIVFSLIVGYLFSFYTHRYVEKSPSNLSHPYWGVVAVLKMFKLMLQGKMKNEVHRIVNPKL